MRKGLLALFSISIFCISAIAQESNVQKKDPVGQWKFEAPQKVSGKAI